MLAFFVLRIYLSASAIIRQFEFIPGNCLKPDYDELAWGLWGFVFSVLFLNGFKLIKRLMSLGSQWKAGLAISLLMFLYGILFDLGHVPQCRCLSEGHRLLTSLSNAVQQCATVFGV